MSGTSARYVVHRPTHTATCLNHRQQPLQLRQPRVVAPRGQLLGRDGGAQCGEERGRLGGMRKQGRGGARCGRRLSARARPPRRTAPATRQQRPGAHELEVHVLRRRVEQVLDELRGGCGRRPGVPLSLLHSRGLGQPALLGRQEGLVGAQLLRVLPPRDVALHGRTQHALGVPPHSAAHVPGRAAAARARPRRRPGAATGVRRGGRVQQALHLLRVVSCALSSTLQAAPARALDEITSRPCRPAERPVLISVGCC